jgi:hypothetical protein
MDVDLLFLCETADDLIELINEDILYERSHRLIKHCYRIGYDINTGERAAVQFELDTSKITRAGDANILNDKTTDNLDLIRKTIRKTGHIDFTTSPLKVISIFNRGGRQINSIEMIALFNNTALKPIVNDVGSMLQDEVNNRLEKYKLDHKDILNKMDKNKYKIHFSQLSENFIQDILKNNVKSTSPDLFFSELMNTEFFKKSFVKIVKRDRNSFTQHIETYHISKNDNDLQGDEKYKTTKLFWDPVHFANFQFTPRVRGYLTKPLGYSIGFFGPPLKFQNNYNNLTGVKRGEMTVLNNKIENYKSFLDYIDKTLEKYEKIPNKSDMMNRYINQIKDNVMKFKSSKNDLLQKEFPRFKKSIKNFFKNMQLCARIDKVQLESVETIDNIIDLMAFLEYIEFDVSENDTLFTEEHEMENKNKNVLNLTYNQLPGYIRTQLPKILSMIKNEMNKLSYYDKYGAIKNDRTFNMDSRINTIGDMKYNDVPIGVITKLPDNKYTAMIQATGHIINPMKDDKDKLFHTFMLNVYNNLKADIKEQFKMDLNNDDFKEHKYEGFDVYPSPLVAKQIWDKHRRSTIMTEDAETIENRMWEVFRTIIRGILSVFNWVINHIKILLQKLPEEGLTITLHDDEIASVLSYIKDPQQFKSDFMEILNCIKKNKENIDELKSDIVEYEITIIPTELEEFSNVCEECMEALERVAQGTIINDKGIYNLNAQRVLASINKTILNLKNAVNYILKDFQKQKKNDVESSDDSVTEAVELNHLFEELEEFEERYNNYEFRLIIGEHDGHLYKIIYELNPENVIGSGAYANYVIDKERSNEEIDNEIKDRIESNRSQLKKDVRKGKGSSGNYASKGNKVVGIVDMTTGKKGIKEVSGFPPIHNSGGSIAPVSTKYYGNDNDKKLYKYGHMPGPDWEYAIDQSRKNGQQSIHYKVGEIDNTSTFKSTKIRNVLKMLRLESATDSIMNESNESIVTPIKLKFDELPKSLQNTIKLLRQKGINVVNKEISKDSEHHRYFIKVLNDYDHIRLVIYTPSSTDQDGNPLFREDDYCLLFLEFGRYDEDQDLYYNYLKKILNGITTGFNHPDLKIKKEFDYNGTHYEFEISNKLLTEIWKNYTEFTNDEQKANKTLRTLTRSLMNDIEKKKNVTQYTANIYANLITKNILSSWTDNFSKFTITLDSYQSFPTLEFIVPKMNKEFISRFVKGKESLGKFVNRRPEIKIKMSPRIFHTIKNEDDPYNFFKRAVKYYDTKLDKIGNKFMTDVIHLNNNMKHLIVNTKLSGLVTYPLSMLFIFDDVNMNDKESFTVKLGDIKAVSKFLNNIVTRYAAPEKEKAKILEDLKNMLKDMRDSTVKTESTAYLYHLIEGVQIFYDDGYENILEKFEQDFIASNIDNAESNEEVKYLKEAWGVKKLKKIPADLIPYIIIEIESIQDTNDKMIIVSYICGKLELVDWYIQVLDVGSKKYIVPHTKPQLQRIKTQLLDCYKKAMDIKIVNPNISTSKNTNYPPGYEG